MQFGNEVRSPALTRFPVTGNPEVEILLDRGLSSCLPTNRPESLFSAKPRRPYNIARIVVLKLKTSESCEELRSIALSLRPRAGLSPRQRFRLVGVGLSNFCAPEDATAR